MVLNKKGQAIFVKIMICVLFFIVAVILIPPINEGVIDNMNSTALNCSDTSISVETNATCVVMDMFLFYFISVCIAIGIAFVSGKKDITGVVTSIVVFIVTTILISPVKKFIVIARDASHLNCASASISVGARLTCIVVDLWLFYFFIVCIAAGITYFFAKKVLPERL